MGSMWPWGALGSVGNAQRAVAPPWGPRLPGDLPPDVQAPRKWSPNLASVLMRPPGHGKALAFLARPGSDKSYKREG